MDAGQPPSCTAFAGTERVASGAHQAVALACKALIDAGDRRTFLIFDDVGAEPFEMDLRGSPDDVRLRFASDGSPAFGGERTPELSHRGPGRPKLGVVGREVTLLPRHWEWLNEQPGGASVALRKLVEQARRANEGKDRVRRSQEGTFRFMSAMAGNEPGFEDAARALFAGDKERFETHSELWPRDLRDYARALAADSFA